MGNQGDPDRQTGGVSGAARSRHPCPSRSAAAEEPAAAGPAAEEPAVPEPVAEEPVVEEVVVPGVAPRRARGPGVRPFGARDAGSRTRRAAPPRWLLRAHAGTLRRREDGRASTPSPRRRSPTRRRAREARASRSPSRAEPVAGPSAEPIGDPAAARRPPREPTIDHGAVLTAALDSLGQAHHRPFSRA